MNHGHGPAIPQSGGAMYVARRQHDIPYAPPSQPPYHHLQNPYHGYHQTLPQHFHSQPPQQWAYYNSMPQGMPRPYSQYPPLMAAAYSFPHPPAVMSPRPNPPQHVPSSSSVRSHQGVLSPTPPLQPSYLPPSTPTSRPSPPPAPSPALHRMPYYPPLPWFSVSEAEFPPRNARRRKRRTPMPQDVPLELPQHADPPKAASEPKKAVPQSPTPQVLAESPRSQSTPTISQVETPGTSQAPSENESTMSTTPSSVPTSRATTQSSGPQRSSKAGAIVPVVPNIPSLSRSSKKDSALSVPAAKVTVASPVSERTPQAEDSTSSATTDEQSIRIEEPQVPSPPPVKIAPKSWADLVRTKTASDISSTAATGGATGIQPDGFQPAKAGSLPDVLASYNVRASLNDGKIAFLEPRGLINTGNMCYMNAILQILVFCVPFYHFLDQVGKQAVFSFKSDTPMVDAMIMFIREFAIIDSAVSAEQLRLRLKDVELEQYGEVFTPDFVYEVIRRLSRFSSMRRGHQQDAEEFLGFLLEEMHEECVRTMKGPDFSILPEVSQANGLGSPVNETTSADDQGWLEVGPRQRAAVTRSSGIIAIESPITKIFGGKLRSELRVPGAKNSVTLEPYQPLQLDIGAPNVNNILDALKGLTRSETLHGDFNSPRGPGTAATKQVFIETLPPVLILHLKRFQYDNTGGTQKIWKKVGYPLDLEIPKEVFPQHKRGALSVQGGLPQYRLIGVVYHHGKNASGGHYTVDVRRQEGREWIRFDDTVVRRIRNEDVAEGGSEEDPKVLAAALEQHKRDQSSSSNIFDQVRDENEESVQAEKGWSQVNGTAAGGAPGLKKWSGVVNGTATPTMSSGKRTPVGRYSIKDNKVAYILFYERVGI